MPSSSTPARLTETQLAELLALAKAAGAVELKLTIPAGAQLTTIRSLPLDPVEAEPRQVYFFDTPDLTLNKAGIVVRARRMPSDRADTVIKLRPVDPTAVPDDTRRDPAFSLEVDAIPGGFVCSGSMKGRTTGTAVRDAVTGELPIRKLFTKEQRTLYAEHAPAGIDLDSLSILGPTFLLRSTFTPKKLGRRLVAELWLYPDGTRLLELSTKCQPTELFQAVAETRLYLGERGITASGGQQTKTKAALQYYQSQLKPSTRRSATRRPTTRSAPPKTSPKTNAKPAATRTNAKATTKAAAR